jgi:hypothetical protein
MNRPLEAGSRTLLFEAVLLELSFSFRFLQGFRLTIGCRGSERYGGVDFTKFFTGVLCQGPTLVFWISLRYLLGLVGQPGSSAAQNSSPRGDRRRGISVMQI